MLEPHDAVIMAERGHRNAAAAPVRTHGQFDPTDEVYRLHDAIVEVLRASWVDGHPPPEVLRRSLLLVAEEGPHGIGDAAQRGETMADAEYLPETRLEQLVEMVEESAPLPVEQYVCALADLWHAVRARGFDQALMVIQCLWALDAHYRPEDEVGPSPYLQWSPSAR